MKKIAVIGIAWVAFLALPALLVQGKTLVEDDYTSVAHPGREAVGGEITADNTGRGWKARAEGDHLRYLAPEGTLPAREGTVELVFQPGSLVGRGSEALCTFEGPGGNAILTLYFSRARRLEGKDVSVLWLDAEAGRTSPFGDLVSLDRMVASGESVVLSLAWSAGDPSSGGFFLDGKPLRNFYSMSSGTLLRTGSASSLARLISGVESVRLGTDGRGKHPLVSNAVRRLAVHDRNLMASGSGKGGIDSVRDDSFKIAGISGKLVAGDTVTVELTAPPGGKASFDMGVALGIPLAEAPTASGSGGGSIPLLSAYTGSYVIRPGDDFENGRIIGRYVSGDNVASDPVTSASTWTIDTKPRVTFVIDRKDLSADSTSKARIKLVAKDANGSPVKGRHLKLTLATTDEYTGTVGAGDFGKEVGATVETRWRGETDSWGEVEFDYKAGFAAKTVVLTAKDLDSGGVSVDYITAFKEASIDIALMPPASRAAARRSVQYILKVAASRTELTADGRSRSVIRATLLDPNGTPVTGDPVQFTLSSANGTLRAVTGTSDSSGTATAEYIAGKKIGIVVVSATATLRNVTGNVSITLLSDAPAKVILKARPSTLPADGTSRADIGVTVTDINDNPNANTRIEFRIARGGGRLDSPDRLTDRFGDAANRYTAGTTAGVATITATVRSKTPTESELARARNVLFARYSADGDEIRVEKWLKKKGDTAVKGEPVMQYTVGRSRDVQSITAPFDLRIDEILVEYWDRGEIGQTVATVTPVVK
ncbi:MAG: Ig-like domain-containing protein [Deltaproteobacteria bacterium]|nr:Ig-like domain-containing protein [Deltaproteobacteria bacterium]